MIYSKYALDAMNLRSQCIIANGTKKELMPIDKK